MLITAPKLNLTDSLKIIFSKIDRYVGKIDGMILQQINFKTNEFKKNGLNTKEINLEILNLKKQLEKEKNLKIDKFSKKVKATIFEIKNQTNDLQSYKPLKFSSLEERQWSDGKLSEEDKNIDIMAKYKMHKIAGLSMSPSFEDKIMYQILRDFREIVGGHIADQKNGQYKSAMLELEKNFIRSPDFKDYWYKSNESKKLEQKISRSVTQIKRNDLIKTYAFPIVSSVIDRNLLEYKTKIDQLYKNNPNTAQKKMNEKRNELQQLKTGINKLLPKLIEFSEKQEKFNRITKSQVISFDTSKLEKELNHIQFNINLIVNTISSQTLNKVKELYTSFIRISKGEKSLHEKEPENYNSVSINIIDSKGKNKSQQINQSPLSSQNSQQRFKTEVKKISHDIS